MLPAAAPTACKATTNAAEIPSAVATPCCNSANMRLLTVLLPAMNAPSAPIKGAKNGQTAPTFTATQSAITMGMLSIPSALTSELM